MTSLDNYAAILVAAGLSSRFGPEDKLLTEINDAPLLSWSLKPLLEAGFGEIVVVTGANDKAVRALCGGRAVTFANNPDSSAGLGASIAVGAASIGDKVEGVFICLGDMPLIPASIFRDLAGVLASDEKIDAAAPVYNSRRGHPVLFHGRHLNALKNLKGDEGARHILAAPRFNLSSLNVEDEGVVRDIDSFDELLRLQSEWKGHGMP